MAALVVTAATGISPGSPRDDLGRRTVGGGRSDADPEAATTEGGAGAAAAAEPLYHLQAGSGDEGADAGSDDMLPAKPKPRALVL